MLALASTLVLAFAVPQAAPSPQTVDAREMTLALPHALRKGETAWLQVEVGAVGHDQIQLTTHDGQPLGTISPFSMRPGQAAGTYTLPLPTGALSKGRLSLRMSMMQSGRAPRAPTTDEVKSWRLLVRRFKGGG